MSIAVNPKLKYPDYFLKEMGNMNQQDKENISLVKQMQNLKMNKYAKYFKGNNSNQTNQSKNKSKEKEKENKISINKKNKNRELTQVKLIQDINDCQIDDLDSSLISYEDSTTTGINSNRITAKENYVCLNNNLEVIIEQETQRTETILNTTKSLIINQSHGKNQKIIKSPQNSNLNNELNISKGESENMNNPQYNYEYLMDIHHNLLQEEKVIQNLSTYMSKQNDINEKMRAILIDWIIDVHHKFKLTPETLFLTVYLLDRYLSEKNVKRDRIQLIGVAALLIACKYEEIFSPELRDFEYITEKAYRKEEITKLEVEMLKLFEFKITVPSTFRFYEIITQKLKLNEKEFALGRYFLEVFLIDYRYTKYLPSQIACSVCFLVISYRQMDMSNINSCYKLRNFLEIYNCDIGDFLKDCCKDICFILENLDSTGLISVKRKFLSKEFFGVAKFNTKLCN